MRPQPRAAASLYRGIRVTLVQAPLTHTALVTVSVKGAAQRWDEWSLLFPALRADIGTPQNAYEVVEVLREALAVVSAELE